MNFRVRFTGAAVADLERLQVFLIDRAQGDTRLAEDALEAIRRALPFLETSPFACRRVPGGDRHLRELMIGHGASGYVALFAIGDGHTITVAAVRHQREDDYR